MMANSNSDSRRAKIGNALVSSTFKLGTNEELRTIGWLFVKTGNAGKLAERVLKQSFTTRSAGTGYVSIPSAGIPCPRQAFTRYG